MSGERCAQSSFEYHRRLDAVGCDLRILVEMSMVKTDTRGSVDMRRPESKLNDKVVSGVFADIEISNKWVPNTRFKKSRQITNRSKICETKRTSSYTSGQGC